MLGYASAKAHREPVAHGAEPLAFEVRKRVGQTCDAVLSPHSVHADDELLTAPPSHDIVPAEVAPQTLPESSQDRVADGVAVTVVDLLEMVKIEYRNRDRLCKALGKR